LQALPSPHVVPAASGVCVTPAAGSQASAVHGLPSSIVGAVPVVQTPAALHVSAPLQALPSEHGVPVATGVCVTPPAGEHASVVHGLPSSTAGGVPDVHAPLASQVSLPLQAFPSEHEEPAAFAGFEHTPVATSQVPAA
jgi:hypothetical protein